jgi:signal transduction histidine kinase
MVLRRLRWQLTALYLLAAVALIALVGGGAYYILALYFERTTDLALQNRMALEFRRLHVQPPQELLDAEQQWYLSRGQPTPRPLAPSGEEAQEGDGHAHDVFDGELASVYVYSLSPSGELISTAPGPIGPDQGAATAALAGSADWRTLNMTDGARVRLLTYRITAGNGVSVLQAGRSLADQDQALARLLLGLLALGGLSTAALGAASWWLAGRSLAPAQQAWERQQTFVANASHELRTPLTLIRASAEFARRGLAEGDERRELLGDILAETDHTSRLVDDLLLLSRLDAGRLTLAHGQVDLDGLLDDVGRTLGRLAEERRIRLRVTPMPLRISGDPTRVRQVLLILIDNALRYTPAGGEIRVSAQPQGRAVCLSVADEGPGISAEHLPRLFERFYRADPARSDKSGGAGLGLAIARALVEAQHGQIGVESQPGRGARFWFTLPAAA